MQENGFSDQQIDRFRAHQRTAFAIQESIASSLVAGMTEKDVTRQLMKGYRAAGAQSYFHLPVALFGSRTALPDPWDTLGFWPTDRLLQEGDAIILDGSPIFDGFVVDTSYATSFGPNAAQATMAADDLPYRHSILDAVRAGATFAEIAVAVDEHLTANGYSNRHVLHPGEVLGHRALYVDRDPQPDEFGFDQGVIRHFVKGSKIAEANAGATPSPTWNHHVGSQHKPADGLWAVEPHIARDGLGVKWEELLVIQGSEVYWLDDDVPHVTNAAASPP